jgi:hypothetical protein
MSRAASQGMVLFRAGGRASAARHVLSATECLWQLAAVCHDARGRWKHWLLVFAHIWEREEELGVTDRRYTLHSCMTDAKRREA